MPSALTVSDLRCEYRRDPLGIAVPEPRLSWIVASDRRAQAQSAYRVLVASTVEQLAQERGDLWDSGRISGDQTAHVVYRGRELNSRERCCWSVRVWDAQGETSAWSAPASWEMALLSPSE